MEGPEVTFKPEVPQRVVVYCSGSSGGKAIHSGLGLQHILVGKGRCFLISW
jgi:hypothetical protein